MTTRDALKILIIGGVAGGATAAGRARRVHETAEITVLERGPAISFANCGLPYHIAGDIPRREQLLLRTPQAFHDRYRVHALTGAEAIRIDRERKTVLVRQDSHSLEMPYDRLILSQGAEPVLPTWPGSELMPVLSLRSLDNMDRIIETLDRGDAASAVIVGGGFIGIEMAEALHRRGVAVSVVELGDQILAQVDPELAHMAVVELERNGVRVFSSTAIARVFSDRVELTNGTSLPADFILASAGVRPETELARAAGLVCGATGGVQVNEFLQSSDPDIFVIGDMAETLHRVSGRKARIPLAGPANRQGRIAGENAALGPRKRYRGALGTSVLKIFDRTLAATGLSEKTLQQAGVNPGVSFVHGANHAGYYPGSERIALKLVYDRDNAKLLGAQAFGGVGTEKRVDVAATALAGGLTVYDLAELDLAYAPPYSSANDPINTAAFVACNALDGMTPAISAREFLDRRDWFVLDVRNPGEILHHPVPADARIPVDQLRAELERLPRDRTIAVLCQSGQRSYIAQRILAGNGFEHTVNITGGDLALSAHPAFALAIRELASPVPA